MSNINQFMSSGGYQIGDGAYIPDSGTVITRPDFSKFLRSGTVALSSLYPLAAKVESLMVHGEGVSTLPVAASITGYAYDGNNTVVLCYGDSANVLVSTDKGRTFSTVPYNLSGGTYATSVIHNGSRFIVSGIVGTTVACSYSTTGASFIAGGTVTVAGTYASSTTMVWDGTIAVIGIGGNSVTASVVTTTDGVTLTARSIPSGTYATSGAPIIICNPLAGVNRWLLVGKGGTVAARSTAANASAWEAVVLPDASMTAASAGNGIFVCAKGTNFYASPTGATGSWATLTNPQISNSSTISGSFGIAGDLSIIFDGTRFVIGSANAISLTYSFQFSYTQDFKSFTARQTIPQVVAPTNGYSAVIPIGANLLIVPSGSGTANKFIYAANWLASSEYVGSSVPFWAAQVAGGAGIPQRTIYGYVRVV